MKPAYRRLHALLLFLVFLGGGTSLPGLDAIIFHRNGETSRSIAHVETNSGCASHDGHCGIGCPASAAEAIGAQLLSETFDLTTAAITPRLSPSYAAQLTEHLGFLSRAPPVPRV